MTYTTGTRLAEIPPEHRGVPWTAWLLARIAEQAEAYRRRCPSDNPAITARAISGARDNYGTKGIQPWTSGRWAKEQEVA